MYPNSSVFPLRVLLKFQKILLNPEIMKIILQIQLYGLYSFYFLHQSSIAWNTKNEFLVYGVSEGSNLTFFPVDSQLSRVPSSHRMQATCDAQKVSVCVGLSEDPQPRPAGCRSLSASAPHGPDGSCTLGSTQVWYSSSSVLKDVDSWLFALPGQLWNQLTKVSAHKPFH